MKAKMKNTLRNMMVATVASGLLLSACGSSEAERQQPKMDTSSLRAPANNPQLANGLPVAPEGLRAPEANPQDSLQAMPQLPQEDTMAATPRMEPQQAARQEESGGLFSWAWKKQPQQEAPVNTMERRVPVLNQDSSAQIEPMGMASYEAAAPVGEVAMQQPQLAPHSDIVVADEVIMMDDTFTPIEKAEAGYPSLASVPPRPERINAVNEKAERLADLQDARTASLEQERQLAAQVASDSEGSLLPQAVADEGMTQSQMDAEFAALVAADQARHGQQVVVMEDVYEQAPAPITMANAQPAAVQPWDAPMASNEMPVANAPVVDTGWQPVTPSPQLQAQVSPQVVPQTQPVVAPQADEWVSLQQDPASQLAVPVEQVDVANSPEVVAVSPIAVVPEGGAESIQLTPPSAFGKAVRTLPESRYAARRQAVYMQRYSRVQQAGGY